MLVCGRHWGTECGSDDRSTLRTEWVLTRMDGVTRE